MNGMVTLADVDTVVVALGLDGNKSRWYVKIVVTIHSRQINGKPWRYLTAAVLRGIEEEYGPEIADAPIGTLSRERSEGYLSVPAPLHVQLNEGVDIPLMEWFVKLAKERGVEVALPVSAQRVLALLK